MNTPRFTAPASDRLFQYRRAALRAALFSSASALVICMAAPAHADNECGAASGSPPSATCPAGSYPGGIRYSAGAAGLTINGQGVDIGNTATRGIEINTTGEPGPITGPLTINVNGGTIAPRNPANLYGVSILNVAGAVTQADQTANVNATIDVQGVADVRGVFVENFSQGDSNLILTYTGPSVNVVGGDSAGLHVRSGDGDGNATIDASGNITALVPTGGTLTFGILAQSNNNGIGAGDATINYHQGTISATGSRAFGVNAISYGDGSASVTTDAGTTIIVAGDGAENAYSAVSVTANGGSAADGTAVTANIASTIQNTGAETPDPALSRNPIGIRATSYSDAPVTVNFTGPSITTSGGAGVGIIGQSSSGDVTVTSSGAITTDGQLAHGIVGTSGVVQLPTLVLPTLTDTYPDEGALLAASGVGGDVSVTSTGAIATSGAGAHGILALTTGGAAADVTAGNVTTTGEGTFGVVAIAPTGAATVTVDGDVQGGWVAANTIPTTLPTDFSVAQTFATGVLMGGDATTLTNNGSVGSLSDSAIIGIGATQTVDNLGTVTGYVNFAGGDVTFNNLSSDSFDIRNYADTDGDGARDTEAVAISDFGGGASVFNNDTAGVVTLLNVPAGGTIVTTGQIVPEGANAAFHDITLDGVEQGQLLNLPTFRNAGAIILQDMLTGGTTPVAGDVLAITGGPTAGAPGGGTFISDGGSLRLDTVLNAGGPDSQSDVLQVDGVTVGAGGATHVFIQNAGGTGAATTGDGILVVDVLDPTASAADGFTMDNLAIAGAYQYDLFQGGDAANGGDATNGNWYLRSSLAPTTDAYAGYMSQLLRFNQATIGTLQQRVGNRYWPSREVTPVMSQPAPVAPTIETRTFIVYFDFDKSNLNADAQRVVADAAAFAKSGGDARISVVGHTDTRGSDAYNIALSERRAQTVANALSQLGVSSEVGGVAWHGENQPAVATGDNVKEQANRRVTIDVQQASAAPPPAAPVQVGEQVTVTKELQGRGAWARIYGETGDYETDPNRKAEEDLWFVQAGYDAELKRNESGLLVGGADFHFGGANTDISNAAFGDIGSVDTDALGFGLSLTWYGNDGLYLDGVFQNTWYDTDITSGRLGTLREDGDGYGWAISGEAGKRYPVGEHTYLVPQGQLTYSSASFEDFTDPFGAVIDEDDNDSLLGRIGLAYEYLDASKGADGQAHRMQGYGIVNVLYEFLDGPSITANGVSVSDEADKWWGELGGGLTYSVNTNVSLYAEAAYKTSLENFDDSDVLRGNVGMRLNW